jgi:hypothetical protein
VCIACNGLIDRDAPKAQHSTTTIRREAHAPAYQEVTFPLFPTFFSLAGSGRSTTSCRFRADNLRPYVPTMAARFHLSLPIKSGVAVSFLVHPRGTPLPLAASLHLIG